MDKPSSGPCSAQLQLPPGFRFHPTDEELVVHYLARKAASRPFSIPIIAEVDLYKFDPWDLPDKALFGEKEWYFFSPRDRKYPNGARPNRAAASGYWKATGTDKPILSGGSSKVGVKKALVFYKGRAPKGVKTNWIMHEYRLAESGAKPTPRRKGSLRLDDWVLCRIYRKSASAHKAMAPPKLEADDESCLEEVLASLPDIDDSKICLPRLGSFTAMLAADQQGHNELMENSGFGRDGSENGSRTTAEYPVVENSLYDTRYAPNLNNVSRQGYQQFAQQRPNNFNNNNEMVQLRALRQQQQQQQEMKSDSCLDDEVQSSCRASSYSHHHHQNLLDRAQLQQQQQRLMHHNQMLASQFGGLTGYYFRQGS